MRPSPDHAGPVEFPRPTPTQLPFPDASFEAAHPSGFALFTSAARAGRQRVRAVCSCRAGALAVTVWDEPQRTALFDAVLAALDDSGATPPPTSPTSGRFLPVLDDGAIRTLLDGKVS